MYADFTPVVGLTRHGKAARSSVLFQVVPCLLIRLSWAVLLSNLYIGGTLPGGACPDARASISGGGFEALHVFDSMVEGAAPGHRHDLEKPRRQLLLPG